ncbi:MULTISPECIES: ATP-binding protein [unclassified Streptomyces]|uniref:ATP-binding protein n=1 Tax=unclassified Streptomyces TaxID=2593676 RepID=UPI0003A6C9E0|nr:MULTISPECIES: ATP-binding protein [unclassified Streptomyces]
MSTLASRTPQPDTEDLAPPDSPLTTKEGWRRYVEHETTAPTPLSAAQRAALTAREQGRQDNRRREYHADLPLVNTPTIRKVISTSRLLVQLNRHQVSARRGVILSGASGTGKTTALTQLGRAHELSTRRRHPRDRFRLPVLYVTVPPAATPKMLAMEFARFFGLTLPARANHTDVVDAVCATAAHVHVDLVLVNELHNLNLGSRVGAEASDQLKYFAERLPATFAYAGMHVESQGLFAGTRGRQIAGRFVVIPAAPFSYATNADKDAWRGLVSTLETMLRLHEHAHRDERLPFPPHRRHDRQPLPAHPRRRRAGHRGRQRGRHRRTARTRSMRYRRGGRAGRRPRIWRRSQRTPDWRVNRGAPSGDGSRSVLSLS